MSYKTRNFKIIPGSFTVTSPKFAFTRIHQVSRHGIVQRPVPGYPESGTREFFHDQSAGKITFGVPGDPAIGVPNFEDIQVTLLES